MNGWPSCRTETDRRYGVGLLVTASKTPVGANEHAVGGGSSMT